MATSCCAAPTPPCITPRRRGRNRFEFFDKRLHSGALTRLSVEAELHRAIERDEFQLDYQPIVDLRTGAIDGVEALLRWQHPTRGLLLPEDFLGVAEDAGLLVPVGDWVLREACAPGAALARCATRPPRHPPWR